jgi:CheY-like chemotaxis protein
MRRKQKKILLFEEDFESMRDLKEHLEEEMEWDVELTADRSLLERLGHERFDLIVVDLMIRPTSLDAEGREVQNVHFDDVNWHKTGLEFLQRLREGKFSEKSGLGTSPDVPVIVLSAVANYSVTNELEEEDIHPNGYLEKPFRLDELIEKIHELLQE